VEEVEAEEVAGDADEGVGIDNLSCICLCVLICASFLLLFYVVR